MAELTEEQQEVVFAAWALAARGKAFVPTEEYVPAAEAMQTKGWLASQRLENGDAAYEFTPEGEAALDRSMLMSGRAAETN